MRKPDERFNADSGRLLWKKEGFEGVKSRTGPLERITHLTLCVGDEGVFLLEEDSLVGLDLKTGEELWRAARPPKNNIIMKGYFFRLFNACTLLYHDGVGAAVRVEVALAG